MPEAVAKTYTHQRAQVPKGMRLLDDPWGITWRVVNLLRRMSLRRWLRFQGLRFRKIEFDRPIFVLGPPRSGTTTLFHLLGERADLGSLQREGHDVWRKFHHPRKGGWSSDAVGKGEVRPGERRFVARYLRSYFPQRRFVEKTPENCLRIPYLLELFPDAHFVFVRRDPRATISSMINGWRHPEGKFRSYFVPEELKIPGHSRPHQWCFALIDGWRLFKDKPVPRIAAEQWRQSIRGAIAGRKIVPAAQWHEVALEEFTRDPAGAMASLCERLGLAPDLELSEKAKDFGALNSMKESGPSDWRENKDEVMEVLPYLAEEIRECGYDVNELLNEG